MSENKRHWKSGNLEVPAFCQLPNNVPKKKAEVFPGVADNERRRLYGKQDKASCAGSVREFFFRSLKMCFFPPRQGRVGLQPVGREPLTIQSLSREKKGQSIILSRGEGWQVFNQHSCDTT